MNIHCPRCGSHLPTAQINVVSDVGACRACENVFSISVQLENQLARHAPVAAPPEGTWLVERADGFTLGATVRSAQTWFLLPFMTVWSCGLVGGWSRHADPQGGIVFLFVGLWFWSYTIFSLFGESRLSVRGDEAEIFTGIGWLGSRTRLAWSAVRSVREISAGKRGKALSLVTDDTQYHVMTGASDARRRYLLGELRRRIVNAPVAPFRL